MSDRRPFVVPVSAGEVIDKITILEIKAERITDAAAVRNVEGELGVLREALAKLSCSEEVSAEIDVLIEKLRRVNAKLWDVEDALRDKEKAQAFDEDFIALARSVYKTNDCRFKLKSRLNTLLDSWVVEEKSHH